MEIALSGKSRIRKKQLTFDTKPIGSITGAAIEEVSMLVHDPNPRRPLDTFYLYFVLPLLVTIVGGLVCGLLLQALLEPKQQPEDLAIIKQNRNAKLNRVGLEVSANPLIGKWYTGNSTGERSIEFCPTGFVIRERDVERWTHTPSGRSETYPYKFEAGQLHLNIEGIDVKVVKIDPSELVLSWHEKPIAYKKSTASPLAVSIAIFTRANISVLSSCICLLAFLFFCAAGIAAKS